jgi:hypothetical protein
MKRFTGFAALAAALAISTSAWAIDVTVSGGASGSGGASAGTPAGGVSAGATGSINAGGNATAAAGPNAGVGAGAGAGAGAAGGATVGVTPPAAGGAAGTATAAGAGAAGGGATCTAFTNTVVTSDAEIAAVRALAGQAKVVVYPLDPSSCPGVRNVVVGDVSKLQAAIAANNQLVADLKAKKIEVGNIVAANVAADGTVSFYTNG